MWRWRAFRDTFPEFLELTTTLVALWVFGEGATDKVREGSWEASIFVALALSMVWLGWRQMRRFIRSCQPE